MKKYVVFACIAATACLNGCGSSGPVFRGDPPAGLTAEEYAKKLRGETEPEWIMRDEKTTERNPSR